MRSPRNATREWPPLATTKRKAHMQQQRPSAAKNKLVNENDVKRNSKKEAVKCSNQEISRCAKVETGGAKTTKYEGQRPVHLCNTGFIKQVHKCPLFLCFLNL